MTSKEFNDLFNILKTPDTNWKRKGNAAPQAPRVKSLNEQKRRARAADGAAQEMQQVNMPSDYVNFRTVHENNGMLRALVEHLPNGSDEYDTCVPTYQ